MIPINPSTLGVPSPDDVRNAQAGYHSQSGMPSSNDLPEGGLSMSGNNSSPDLSHMPLHQAYLYIRKTQGPDGTFMWNGKHLVARFKTDTPTTVMAMKTQYQSSVPTMGSPGTGVAAAPGYPVAPDALRTGPQALRPEHLMSADDARLEQGDRIPMSAGDAVSSLTKDATSGVSSMLAGMIGREPVILNAARGLGIIDDPTQAKGSNPVADATHQALQAGAQIGAQSIWQRLRSLMSNER